MKNLQLTIAGRTFYFEFSDGYVWLIESNNSFSNYAQEFPINEDSFEDFAVIMLRAMGRIKN